MFYIRYFRNILKETEGTTKCEVWFVSTTWRTFYSFVMQVCEFFCGCEQVQRSCGLFSWLIFMTSESLNIYTHHLLLYHHSKLEKVEKQYLQFIRWVKRAKRPINCFSRWTTFINVTANLIKWIKHWFVFHFLRISGEFLFSMSFPQNEPINQLLLRNKGFESIFILLQQALTTSAFLDELSNTVDVTELESIPSSVWIKLAMLSLRRSWQCLQQPELLHGELGPRVEHWVKSVNSLLF